MTNNELIGIGIIAVAIAIGIYLFLDWAKRSKIREEINTEPLPILSDKEQKVKDICLELTGADWANYQLYVVRDINEHIKRLGCSWKAYRAAGVGEPTENTLLYGYAGLCSRQRGMIFINRGSKTPFLDIKIFGATLIHEYNHAVGIEHGDDMADKDAELIEKLNERMGW